MAYENFIRERSRKYGLNPDAAVAIARAEGGVDGWQQSGIKRKGLGSLGGREDSWGPLQMYSEGQGKAFQKETGLDFRDPRNAEKVLDWQLQYMAKNGTGEWYGAKNTKMGNLWKKDIRMSDGESSAVPAVSKEDALEKAVDEENVSRELERENNEIPIPDVKSEKIAEENGKIIPSTVILGNEEKKPSAMTESLFSRQEQPLFGNPRRSQMLIERLFSV